MLKQRLITGPLLIVLVLAIVWCDAKLDASNLPRGMVIFGFCCVLSLLIARELVAFLRAAAIPVSPIAGSLAALLGLVGTMASVHSSGRIDVAGAMATVITLMLIIALLRMTRDRDPKGVLMLAGSTLLCGVYAGVLLAFWMLVRLEHSAWILVGAILTVKSCDIGAYFTGRAIGRTKLIPWLSPKKTWEGLAGGVVLAMAVGVGFAHLSQGLSNPADHISLFIGGLGGALVAVVGQAGDLAESAFKRDAGSKDSGTLLPGMGGVLDVLDSPLFAGPVVYWLLRLTAIS